MTATAAGPSPAIDRALALIEPNQRPKPPSAGAGYLDLLGTAAPASTGMAQNLMLTGVVPAIYERWWRPTLGRAMKGVFGPGMGDEYRIARLLLALRPGDKVLDVACGPGNFTRRFGQVVGADGLVVGIDASPTMLTRAARDTPAAEHPSVAYVRGDAVRLPFADATFDAVCCFAALHLFAEPFEALDHMARVLAPGGRIALFTSCRLRSIPGRVANDLAGARSGMRIFERDEITGALSERGFEDPHQRLAGFTQFVGARRPVT